MLAVLGVLVLFDSWSLPLFLSATLVGMLVVVERETPRYVRPAWIVGMRQFVAVCLVAFALFVLIRIAQLAPESVV
jgi:hypothetical protein